MKDSSLSFPAMPGVRYAVNPQLIGDILGTRFDGRSYIFARGRRTAPPRRRRGAARTRSRPTSEEIVVARVPAADGSEPDAVAR